MVISPLIDLGNSRRRQKINKVNKYRLDERMRKNYRYDGHIMDYSAMGTNLTNINAGEP